MNSILNQIMDRFRIALRDTDEMFNMNLSTESLDLLDGSPYQTEISFNKLLPYADELESEANDFLAKIKNNFGRCVMLRDIEPGCIYWSQMLTKYIELYGLRFHKDEHIAFVKLSYELTTIPNLQPSLVHTFSNLLSTLLKKKETIPPSDLELQWEPLYELCHTVLTRKLKHFSLHRYPPSFENTLYSLVEKAKIYFPAKATQQILDELRPKLCPLDIQTMKMTIKLLQWFLPVQLPVEQHAIGHELWLHNFMKLWEVCNNTHYWENDLMRLIAKLASNNIGYIDWDQYTPIMFTRFVRTLNLPVHYKKSVCTSNHNMDVDLIGEWIASVLGDNSKVQIYLEKFLKTVETYFHPANFGSWFVKLEKLFVKIIYHVVLRLHRERYAKDSWIQPIPESHKLTEANIDTFVNNMMPVTMVAIFNRYCSPNFVHALQYLAIMRPNLVIPNILEKLYPTLGTDIEPHKLITAMTCMTAISRPLVQGSRFINKDYAFTEGPSHVLSILFSSLPGIDPNDPGKCFATLKLIGTYVTLVPIVNCSNSKIDTNEEEQMICEDTSRFEDFVLQFMDKIFILINSSSLEFVRLENQSNDGAKSSLEAMVENSLYVVFTGLLLQTSDSIFVVALNKLRSFIMENTLETKISGHLVAILCKVFSHVNSQVTLKTLVPYLSEQILEAFGEEDDATKEENLDNQLLYFLLLLQRVVETQGDALLPYMDTIFKVLDKVTVLKSVEGNRIGCEMLKNVLTSLSSLKVMKFKRNLDDLEYPYWMDWGESSEIKSSEIKWYVPGEQEIAAVQELFSRYFIPAVALIEKYVNTENSLPRDDLLITLRLLNSVIEGCDSVLPIWSETPIVNEKYKHCVETFKPIIGNKYQIKMTDGSNVRQFLARLMASLQDKMLEDVPDDTKSFQFLLKIWSNLSFTKFIYSIRLGFKRRQFLTTKKMIENKLTGNRGYLPQLLMERVSIQHELRRINAVRAFTPTSQNIMLNLFKLSISKYSRIRSSAQIALSEIINDFPNAYQALVPHIVKVLQQDTEVHHDAYKGVLFLMCSHQGGSLQTMGDWQILSAILPALVLSKPSEKPSVILKQAEIVRNLSYNFPTTNIILDVPDSCVSMASQLWQTGDVAPNSTPPSESEIQTGLQVLLTKRANDLKTYNELLQKLVQPVLESNLHWRHRQIAVHFISALVHPDHKLPTPIVRCFLNALLHDSIDERRLAWSMTTGILKLLKKKHPKIVLNIFNRETVFKPGRRPDNEWLQYNSEKLPTSAKEWDEPRFVHKPYVGYYTWPKTVEVYAPISQQPDLDIQNRQLDADEREIHEFFSNEQNIDKLLKFLTLEEKKGKDKFDYSRYLMFKGLFRNYGDAHLVHFLPQLYTMVQDKHESIQRCAAEIICGLVRGSKYWSFQMTQKMWQGLLPIIKLVLANLTEETLGDWATCFSLIHNNRDPRKLHWLIECLTEESQSAQSQASFVECGRLLILQKALSPQSWRLSEILNRLMPRFEARLLENPFENVRDRLASILVTIFNTNLKFQGEEATGYPELEDFINTVLPRLELLLKSEDRKSPSSVEATRLLNTICRWIIESVATSYSGSVSTFYKLYPIISHLENEETDEELAQNCTTTLAVLANSTTLPKHIAVALDVVEQMLSSSYWSVRAGSLEFLQVFLFHNMSVLLSEKKWIGSVQTLVVRSLQDERVEVRERAAQVFNGMLHCTLEEFKRLAKTKLRNKRNQSTNVDMSNAIRLRHAGVLGMCAFIQAHPYDIPKDIPPIFEHLNLHLNDPEPIPTTIRKTLSDFKRTHCDGWTGIQGLAQDLTEEQYALLQDITVPPTYYA
ncbi:hypothetical protein TSAR_014413 [Trichomalopsis sarcophagae]|uniref:Proteasome activator complex subunit 4 C-terminal domain-containing protein n=1 Tax=Trichomalopsis sarcophagae TaxID=543379 RepID=A0A232ER46_9HYME|nr:hypothetical protein TSAR_014413 [Trichomalopsis sarcophagae]